MRLDRLITLNVLRPLRRALFKVQGSRLKVQGSGPTLNSQLSTINSKWAVPILMYHSISDDPEPGLAPYYRVNTSPAVFRQHMQFLADQGYHTISLNELVSLLRTSDSGSHITHHASRITHQVAITFDDGFRDFYTEAFPVLKHHGFTATMFLPTAFIGDERRQFRPSTLNPQLSTTKDCLTWSEVRELRRHGIYFGSHTVNHPKLVELDWPEITSELSNSKSEIEQHLGEPVTAFCYPFAFPQTDRDFIHRLTDVLSDTGYRSCATTELGRVQPGTDPFRLKRLPANSLDDLALFAAKLDGAYDWLAAPQSAAKALKALIRPQRRASHCPIGKGEGPGARAAATPISRSPSPNPVGRG